MEIPEILDSVRDQLKKKHIPPENREFIVELLGQVMTSIAMHINYALHPDALESVAKALINNQEILDTIQRQSAEMDALKRITLNLTSSLELQEVLNAVVGGAMQMVPNAQDAHIFLYHEGRLYFGASLFKDGKKNIPYAEPRPEGLTYTVAHTKKIIVVNDIQNNRFYPNPPASWHGSIIGIPLVMGDRVVGVMNLARNQIGTFMIAEARLLTLLADQAAIAITNARLHEVVRGQALKDSLTDLPNRRALDEKLDQEIKRASRTGHDFAVIMMDLDGFKVVNDNYGHDVGDDVLRQIARAFKEAVRTTDFLARYGGDELALILPDTGWPDTAVVTNKILEQMKNLAIELPGSESVHLTVTGGVAIYPRHAVTPSNLLRAADEALYRAKRHQKGTFMVAQRNTGQLPTII